MQRQLWVVCVFYDTQWLLWFHAGFILSLKTTLLIRSYMQTGAIDGTHSQQTECPYSPTTTQMYHSFVLGKTTGSSGPKTPALIVLSDRVSLLLDGCPVIRPNPRLSAPAAQVAEWLHYKPGVPDEWVNECVFGALQVTQRVRESVAHSHSQEETYLTTFHILDSEFRLLIWHSWSFFLWDV